MNVEWIAFRTVLIFHEGQIAEHGGAPGIRDHGALESALTRPRNLNGAGDVFDLAAVYAFGIARAHPFIDGNERTAFVVSSAFLELNGQELTVDEAEAVAVFRSLAAGEFDEPELAEWFRRNCSPPEEAYLVPDQDG